MAAHRNRRLAPRPDWPVVHLLGEGTPYARWSRRTLEERDALVVQFRFVPKYVADKLWRVPGVKKLGFDATCSAGFLALLRAAELWNDAHGSAASFKTYAVRCCKTRIYTELKGANNLIHVPLWNQRQAFWEQIQKALRVASLTPREGHRAFDHPERAELRPCRQVAARDDLDNVRRLVRLLPSPLRWVILMRYNEGLDFKQIGKRMGHSHQWANQVHNKAIERLREYAGVKVG